MAQEIALVVTLATTGTAALYVAWPLLTGKTEAEEYVETDPGEALMDRLLYLEDRTLAALESLDLDRDIGKLPEPEHDRLERRYRRRIGLLNKYMEGLESGRYPNRSALEALEDEVAGEMEGDSPDEEEEVIYPEATDRIEKGRQRQAPAQKGGDQRENRAARGQGKALILVCPSCGHSEVDPDATHCTRCGTPLLCTSCGRRNADAEATFCSRCGARFRRGRVASPVAPGSAAGQNGRGAPGTEARGRR